MYHMDRCRIKYVSFAMNDDSQENCDSHGIDRPTIIEYTQRIKSDTGDGVTEGIRSSETENMQSDLFSETYNST